MSRESLTGPQKAISILSLVCLLAYAGANLGLGIKGISYLNDSAKELSDVTENWTTMPIVDITVADTCPTGYLNPYVAGSFWPGTQQGCYCGDVSLTTREEYQIDCKPWCKKKCPASYTNLGCKTVQPKGQIKFYYWAKIASVKSQICVKRARTDNYLTNVAYLEQCPAGYIKCGKRQYSFCSSEGKCPITRISITSISHSLVATCTASSNCNVLSNNGTVVKVLKYERSDTYNAFPLAQFTIKEYYGCKNFREQNLTPNRKLFYLFNSDGKMCDMTRASNWYGIDSITEANLFAANDLTSDISSFSTYQDPANDMSGYYESGKNGNSYEYSLYVRSYFEWPPNCLDKIEELFDIINTAAESKNKMKTPQNAFMIASIVAASVLVGILSVMELLNLCGRSCLCVGGSNPVASGNKRRALAILVKLSQLGVQTWALIVCNSMKKFFTNLDNCASGALALGLSEIASTYEPIQTNNAIAVGITGAAIFLELFFLACTVPKRGITISSSNNVKNYKKNKAKGSFEMSSAPKQYGSPISYTTPNQELYTKPGTQPTVQNNYYGNYENYGTQDLAMGFRPWGQFKQAE